MPTATPTKTPPRRRLTWIAMALLALLLVACVAMIAPLRYRSWRAMSLLEREGVGQQMTTAASQPEWQQLLLGSDDYQHVQELTFLQVTLSQRDIADIAYFDKLFLCRFYDCDNIGWALPQIARLEQVRWIHIDNGIITNESLAELNGASLESLGFFAVPLGDINLDPLSQLPKLERLSIGRTAISAEQVEALSDCPHLAHLTLDNLEMSNREFSLLANFPALKWLRLRNIELPPEAFLSWRSPPHLRVLYLKNVDLDDKGLASLQEASSLKALYIFGTRVTSEGVEAFKKQRPNCEIHSDHASNAGK